MKRYFKYVKPYWIFFVLSPLLMIVEVFCDVRIPSLAASVLNEGVGSGNPQKIVELAIIMILFVILAIISGTSASYCASKASVNFSCDLREDIFKKIQEFSFVNIDKFSTGSLVTRLTNDITQLQQIVVMSLRMLFRAPGMLIGSIIMSFQLNAKIALIFLVLVPVLVTITIVILVLCYKKFALLQIKIDGLNSNIREFLTNIRVIKALTREEHEDKKFQKVNEDLTETGLSAFKINILQMPLMTLAVNLGTIAIIWFGSIALNAGEMDIGNISAFITYLTQTLMSVSMIANIFLQFSRAMASSQRIAEVLDEEVDISDVQSTQKELEIQHGNIEFKNVNFKYFKNSPENVLSNISINIKAGQTVGIIGSTGCGKTSFVHLIPRLYDVSQGEVLIDGVNVKEYSLKNLRDKIAVVLQNNVLFSGTISENLRWGDKLANDDELETVSRWSASYEFIGKQANQYETKLGQGGVNLSGGQKQRLCIARALLKKPKILILDDSTSAVDTATERTINYHLNSELAFSTKIIIAQRITSVIHADMIIVMNEGKIEAVDTHENLLENCETYKEIYISQSNLEVIN